MYNEKMNHATVFVERFLGSVFWLRGELVFSPLGVFFSALFALYNQKMKHATYLFLFARQGFCCCLGFGFFGGFSCRAGSGRDLQV
jgi:hypothetical protein